MSVQLGASKMTSITEPLAKAIADDLVEELERRGIIVAAHNFPSRGINWITVEEAAEKAAGLDRRAIYSKIRTGEIPAYRPTPRRILIDEAEFDAWVKSQSAAHENASPSQMLGFRYPHAPYN